MANFPPCVSSSTVVACAKLKPLPAECCKAGNVHQRWLTHILLHWLHCLLAVTEDLWVCSKAPQLA